jgi:hypothetical protein
MSRTLTAFAQTTRIASGAAEVVVPVCKNILDHDPQAPILVFDDSTGRTVDIDWRGEVADVLARLAGVIEATPARRGPGRPKLGVVAREVTLLPRHWSWLAAQPGGASVALRKLVEHAARETPVGADPRQASTAVDRFLQTMAGDLPRYEEALRAFYRAEDDIFDALTMAWPRDVREHAQRLIAMVRRLQSASP